MRHLSLPPARQVYSISGFMGRVIPVNGNVNEGVWLANDALIKISLQLLEIGSKYVICWLSADLVKETQIALPALQ